MFDLHPLGVMPEDEAIAILTKGLKEIAVKYDEEPLKRNIKAAGGYPHTIQLIGHNLVEHDSDNYIDNVDWNVALFETAFGLREKEFSLKYSFEKKPKERDKILEILANDNKPIPKNELASRSGLKNPYRCLAELKELGAIREDAEGKITLYSQLFRTMILVHMTVKKIEEDSKNLGRESTKQLRSEQKKAES